MNPFVERLQQLDEENRKRFLHLLEKEGEKYQVYPLSAEQERMWFLAKSAGNNSYYNMVYTLEFGKEVSEEILRQAIRQVVDENEMLHTVVFEWEERVYQCVLKNYSLHIATKTVKQEEYEESCKQLIGEEKQTGFNLENEIPIRCSILQSDDAKKIVITLHHMFADGWSMGLIAKRIQQICEAAWSGRNNDKERQGSYYRYIKWQKAKDFTEDKKYWLKRLDKTRKYIKFPTDYKREKNDSFAGDYVAEFLGTEFSDTIRNFAQKKKISVFSLFMTAYQLMLMKVSNQKDVTVGTPVFNRTREEFQSIVGCFANTVAVSYEVAKEASLEETLKQVHKSVLEAMKHQSLPFEQVVELLSVERKSGYTPIYQTVFNLESETVFGNQSKNKTQLPMKMEIPEDASKVQFDLICSVMEKEKEYQIGLAYKTALFKKETIKEMLEIYVTALYHLMEHEMITVDELMGRLSQKKFLCYEEKQTGKIREILEEHFPEHFFDVTYLDFNYLISYTGIEKIKKCEIENLLSEYGKEDIVLVHSVSNHMLSDENTNQQLIKMAMEKEHCQLEKSSAQRKAMVWADRVEKKQTEEEEVTGEPSLLSGGTLEEIPYQVLRDLLLKSSDEKDKRKIHTIQFGDKRKTFDYESLREAAINIAANLQEKKIGKGSFVVLQLPQLDEFIKVFWGCQMAGAVTIPLGIPQESIYREGEASTNKVWNVCKLLQNAVMVAGEKEINQMKQYGERIGEPLTVDAVLLAKDLIEKKNEGYQETELKENDIALMLFTSGSTGIPKGVKLSYRNIIKRSQSTTQRYNFTEREISLNWMPLDHVGGIVMYHILDVYNHAEQIQVETKEILREPLKWLQLLDEFRVSRTWAPNFAYGLLMEQAEKIPELDVDLSCCKFILNGGEAINFTACDQFLRALACKGLSYSSMKPSWGMTETSSGILFSDRFGQVLYKKSVAVGTPNKGVQAKIVDDENNLVPQGKIGRLLVAGETINQGYFKNEEENRKCFTEDGWFDTGDYANIINGEIIITGRNKDIVIVNGVNITCLEVEKALEEVEGVMSGGIACCAIKNEEVINDKVLICYSKTEESRKSPQKVISEMQQILMRQFSMFADEFVGLEEEEMPRTAIGKIDKKVLIKKYEQGEISGFQRETRNSLLECIYRIEKREVELPSESKNKSKKETEYVAITLDATRKTEENLYRICEIAREYEGTMTKLVLLIVCDIKEKALWSMVKGYLPSLSLEQGNIKTILVVTDNICGSYEAEYTAREHRYKTNSTVFYQKGRRYLEELRRFVPEQASAWKTKWNEGVTVLLGGLGGIGKLVCEAMLKNTNANLVLVGKSNLTKVHEKRKIFEQLQTLGTVNYEQADATEANSILEVLEKIEQKYGTVKNIMDLVGDVSAAEHWKRKEDYYIKNMSAGQLSENMQVRVNTIEDIKRFLQNKTGRHVYVLSSITAFYGGISFGSYGAVSSQLFYETELPEQNQYTVVACSKWRDIGMSQGEGEEQYMFSQRLGFDILEGEEAIYYLLRLFAEETSPLIYGLDAMNYQIAKVIDMEPEMAGFIPVQDEEVASTENADNEWIEHKMSCIWKSVLKNENIKKDEKFFEVGGNSLKSIYLIGKINEEFQVDISVVDLFENATIKQLSNYISTMVEGKKEDTITVFDL